MRLLTETYCIKLEVEFVVSIKNEAVLSKQKDHECNNFCQVHFQILSCFSLIKIYFTHKLKYIYLYFW